jgi:hypothetical protein
VDATVSGKLNISRGMMSEFATLLEAYKRFADGDLTGTLSRIELQLKGATAEDVHIALEGLDATADAYAAAVELKRLVGQINVGIHALGILLCAPRILDPGERIESLSLGAGNTGRQFDLETDRRVAEFKFIHWKGGAEAIRQNSVFKDFFLLAEHQTIKSKFLFLLELDRPLRFLRGKRALQSVLKDARLAETYRDKYGATSGVVRDYFIPRAELVRIESVAHLLPPVFLEAVEIDGADEAAGAADLTARQRPNDLRAWLADSDGTRHVTSERRLEYSVGVDDTGLWFTPATTGKPRKEPWATVERVLRRFQETASLRPKDYVDLTRNSSYLLPLIQQKLRGLD